MKIRYLYMLMTFFILVSCNEDDENNLPPAEERTSAAIEALRNELTAPANGWRVNYQPTPGSGIFFMLLEFDKEGMVTIQSDVMENNGEFIEHTIPYRIDNALGLELIFETYGVFHYLFERDQATFGGEFEFDYSGKQNDNLIFVSKSDFSDRTMLTFEPAAPGDQDLLSTDLSANLSKFSGLTPQIFGPVPPIQQLILDEKNISVFWSIDLAKRIIEMDIAGVGTTLAEISANNDNVAINHVTGYAFREGKLVLIAPLEFFINGEEIVISEITLDNFSISGQVFCSLDTAKSPVYEGDIEGLGKVTLKKSLFTSEGTDFQPMAGNPYSVNVFFVFDGEGNSLLEEGLISERFPTASGFIFNYELDSPDQPANAVGLVVEDETGEGQIYLREFEPTSTEGNKVSITLTNNFYYSATPEANVEQDLTEITDAIFEGNIIYASDLPVQGLRVFRLFNPCNQYEFFLVQ